MEEDEAAGVEREESQAHSSKTGRKERKTRKTGRRLSERKRSS